MWIEAILTKDDFVAVLEQILPVKIHFDDDKRTDRWLALGRATAVEMVPEQGLRISCPAELMWSISVVDIPIKLNTLQVLLAPEIVTKERGDILVFNLTLEEADIKGIPSLIDHAIMKAVNEALVRKAMAWDFTRTLTHTVKMPALLDPIESLAIHVAWGKRRVSAEAMALVVSFQLGFNRCD